MSKTSESAGRNFTPSGITKGNNDGFTYADLAKFFSWLVTHKRYYSLGDILQEVFRRNRTNKLPLPPELVAKLVYLWHDNYDKTRLLPVSDDEVPAKGDYQLASVLWDEHLRENKLSITYCTGWTQVVYRDPRYESLPLHLNRWDCPVCKALMCKEWAGYLAQLMGEGDLFIRDIRWYGWPKSLRSLLEPGVDYLTFPKTEELLTVVSKQPMEGATRIPSGDVAKTLEAVLPRVSHRAPWEVSRGWSFPLKQQPDFLEGAILRTRFPPYRQKQIAISLGAQPAGLRAWRLPSGVDRIGWEEQFKEQIDKCEKTRKSVSIELSKRTWKQPHPKGVAPIQLEILLAEENLILSEHSDEFEPYL